MGAEDLASIEQAFCEHGDGPGHRLSEAGHLASMLQKEGAIGRIAHKLIGPASRPVRILLFNKTKDANWSVGWHQDRTISVEHRRKVQGFGPWSVKGGVPHVAPPYPFLADMITLRAHIDDTDDDNAPLKVVDGSHLMGLVPEKDIKAIVGAGRITVCTAKRGDVWVYRTPILHASEPKRSEGLRRVLQVDFSGRSPGGGLKWALDA